MLLCKVIEHQVRALSCSSLLCGPVHLGQTVFGASHTLFEILPGFRFEKRRVVTSDHSRRKGMFEVGTLLFPHVVIWAEWKKVAHSYSGLNGKHRQ